jgi:hypothetical protein
MSKEYAFTYTNMCLYKDIISIIIIIIIIFSGTAAQRGLWPPRSRGFLITHNNAPQPVGLLWTSDQLVAETSTWQHKTHTTDIYALSGILTHDRSRRAAVDLHIYKDITTQIFMYE